MLFLCSCSVVLAPIAGWASYVHNKLHAIADAQHRDRLRRAVFKESRRQLRGPAGVHRVGPAGQDDGLGPNLFYVILRRHSAQVMQKQTCMANMQCQA